MPRYIVRILLLHNFRYKMDFYIIDSDAVSYNDTVLKGIQNIH